jgi:uncharacterized protein (TIGR03437 family)
MKKLLILLLTISSSALAADPVLFYSDLDFGPRTGWDNGTVKGAAVSVWGRNFGTSGTVNIGGQTIASDCTTLVAEWNVTGIARGDKRITFWIPSATSTGDQTISVAVGGVTSNTLPFKVREGSANIFYVSPTGADNTANGRSLSTPYQSIYKSFSPCATGDQDHTAGTCNPLQDGEYIVYARSGTYTVYDTGDTNHYWYSRNLNVLGGTTKRKALIGYPGETPQFPVRDTFIRQANWYMDAPNHLAYKPIDYVTIAKLYLTPYSSATIGMGGGWGTGWRFVGNKMEDLIGPAQTGVMFVGSGSDNTNIYGNVFDNCADPTIDGNMKHIIYIKAQDDGISSADLGRLRGAWNTTIGFNEFINNTSSSNNGGQIFLSRNIWNNGGGVPTDAEYTDNVWIHNNYVYGGTQQILYAGDTEPLNPNAGGGHFYFYNNIISTNNTTFATITAYCGGTYLISASNNTFYHPANSVDDMTYVAACATGTPAVNFTNNILSATGTSQRYGYAETGSTSLTMAYNQYYNGIFNSGNTTPIPSSGGNYTYTAGQIGNPLIHNPGAADFTLDNTSPAIGTGTNLWTSNASLPFGRYDYEGKLRPSSAAWDIGAIQYAAGEVGGGVSVPSIPAGVRISGGVTIR